LERGTAPSLHERHLCLAGTSRQRPQRSCGAPGQCDGASGARAAASTRSGTCSLQAHTGNTSWASRLQGNDMRKMRRFSFTRRLTIPELAAASETSPRRRCWSDGLAVCSKSSTNGCAQASAGNSLTKVSAEKRSVVVAPRGVRAGAAAHDRLHAGQSDQSS